MHGPGGPVPSAGRPAPEHTTPGHPSAGRSTSRGVSALTRGSYADGSGSGLCPADLPKPAGGWRISRLLGTPTARVRRQATAPPEPVTRRHGGDPAWSDARDAARRSPGDRREPATRGYPTRDQLPATHMPMAWWPLLGCQGRCVTGLRDTLSLVTARGVTEALSQPDRGLSQPLRDPCHSRCHSSQGQAVTARGTGACLRGPSRVAPCVPTFDVRAPGRVFSRSTEALSWRS